MLHLKGNTCAYCFHTTVAFWHRSSWLDGYQRVRMQRCICISVTWQQTQKRSNFFFLSHLLLRSTHPGCCTINASLCTVRLGCCMKAVSNILGKCAGKIDTALYFFVIFWLTALYAQVPSITILLTLLLMLIKYCRGEMNREKSIAHFHPSCVLCVSPQARPWSRVSGTAAAPSGLARSSSRAMRRHRKPRSTMPSSLQMCTEEKCCSCTLSLVSKRRQSLSYWWLRFTALSST